MKAFSTTRRRRACVSLDKPKPTPKLKVGAHVEALYDARATRAHGALELERHWENAIVTAVHEHDETGKRTYDVHYDDDYVEQGVLEMHVRPRTKPAVRKRRLDADETVVNAAEAAAEERRKTKTRSIKEMFAASTAASRAAPSAGPSQTRTESAAADPSQRKRPRDEEEESEVRPRRSEEGANPAFIDEGDGEDDLPSGPPSKHSLTPSKQPIKQMLKWRCSASRWIRRTGPTTHSTALHCLHFRTSVPRRLGVRIYVLVYGSGS